MKGRMHKTKTNSIFSNNIKNRHAECSEESITISQLSGFFALLSMTMPMRMLIYIHIGCMHIAYASTIPYS